MEDFKLSSFEDKEYWEQFFKRFENNESFEWYLNYDEMKNVIDKWFLDKDIQILIPGCGNSNLGFKLIENGYKRVINMDIINSNYIYQEKKPNLEFIQSDIFSEDIDKFEQVDAIIDKGLYDSISYDNKLESELKSKKLLNKYSTLLRNDGYLMIVTLGQQFLLHRLLDSLDDHFQTHHITLLHNKNNDSLYKLLPVFVIISYNKRQPSSKSIFTISYNNDQFTLDKENALNMCLKFQKLSIIKYYINNNTCFDIVRFKLISKDYLFHVVICDNTPKNDENCYIIASVSKALFHDVEFQLDNGVKAYCNKLDFKRVCFVYLESLNQDKNFDISVLQDFKDFKPNYTPENYSISIIQLNVGYHDSNVLYPEDVNSQSEIFVIKRYYHEYETISLIFKSCPLTTQSEMILSNGEYSFEDNEYYYSIYFIISGAYFNKIVKGLMIGLGGGLLYQLFFNNSNIQLDNVEYSEEVYHVAKKYFNFKGNAVIQDGLEYIKNCPKYDFIIIDANSDDIFDEMACPNPQFLEKKVLETIYDKLTDDGCLVLNVVFRTDKYDLKCNLDPRLQYLKMFQSIFYIHVENEDNWILFCFKSANIDIKDLRSKCSSFYNENYSKTDKEWNRFISSQVAIKNFV